MNGEDHHAQAKVNAAIGDAILHIKTGRNAEAKEICLRLLAILPDHLDALYLCGLAAQRIGEFALAETQLAHALSLRNDHPQVVEAYGNLMSEAGRIKEAQSALQAAYKTSTLVINNLEMDIAHVCNLHCRGCSHYSNYTLKGIVDFESGGRWISQWAERITPQRFRMLGGEPMLNPRLCDYVQHAALVWPKARREVVSNGFFVNRHAELYKTLSDTNTSLAITLHDSSAEYLDRVKIAEIMEHSKHFGFALSVTKGTDEEFHKLYRGEGPSMKPFDDGDPAASWKACGEKYCPTLHLGKLWKCPPIAFLNTIDARFGLGKQPEWIPYLSHNGLEIDATDEDIFKYLSRPGKVCGMCPTTLVMIKDEPRSPQRTYYQNA